MTILGLDLGTANIGVVVLRKDELRYNKCLKPPCKGVERLAWIWSEIEHVITEYGVTDVAIEGYSYMSKWRAHDLGEVGGIVRLNLHRLNLPFIIVPPPTLKKEVTGKGNSKKEIMILYAFKKWGESFKTTDECDAYCLCRYLQKYGHKKV